MWLKCYVRQAVVAQCGTGVRERAKGGIAPPFAIPAPGQQPRRCAVPTADILVFSVRAYWRFCARDLACLLCLGKVDAGPEPSLLLQ